MRKSREALKVWAFLMFWPTYLFILVAGRHLILRYGNNTDSNVPKIQQVEMSE